MPSNIVSVLNDLIETAKDGETGFRRAADDTTDPKLKPIFAARADDCARAVRQLQAEVQKLGGKPEARGSFSGALHRGWVDVKAAVAGRDAHSILADCERGEDVAKKRYRDALDKGEMPADVRTVVEAQYQAVLQHHEQIRDLRDQYAVLKSAS